MCRAFLGLLFVAVVVLTASTVLAAGQDVVLGPPDFQESSVFTIIIPPIHIVNPPPPTGAGWAGAIISLHNLDNREVDVDAVIGNPTLLQPGNGISPLGPRSDNTQSVNRYVKLLDPSHDVSGIFVQPSQFVPSGPGGTPVGPLAQVQIHVKGTQIGENSDTDLIVDIHNIWHVRQDSFVREMQNSDLVWGAFNQPPFHITNGPDASLNVVPPGSPIALSTGPGGIAPSGGTGPGGRWWHLQASPGVLVPVHFFASQYFATLVDTITVGIEHVPEPAAAVLMVAGIGCGVAARWSRRRRKAAMA